MPGTHVSDATVEFRLPDLGEGVAETEIVRWLVAEGDEVAEDQAMVEVMTDKATVEIPAPAAGRIGTIHAAAGTVVPVGSVIVEIVGATGVRGITPVNAPSRPAAAAAPAPAPAAPEPPRASTGQPGGRVQATPLVRKLASELGVDLAVIAGTGSNGRITEADVRAAGDGAGAAAAPHREGVARTIPIAGVRRAIATQMSAAQLVPTVTVVEECDLTAVDAARREEGLGFLAYLVEAVVSGFEAVPTMNAHLDAASQQVVVYDRVDVGIAVQTDAGLVVPVLRGAGQLDRASIERQVALLAEGARAGTLTPADLRGSTFTITSAGKLGGLFTTPLLNIPEVGILGLHRVEDRAVVRDGEVVVRRMANLSVTFDHRANDGVAASTFLLAVIDSLQSVG